MYFLISNARSSSPFPVRNNLRGFIQHQVLASHLTMLHHCQTQLSVVFFDVMILFGIVMKK